MPYSTPVAYRRANELVVELDLPEKGELSMRGRAENLVDPSRWWKPSDEHQDLSIKLTVCRRLIKWV